MHFLCQLIVAYVFSFNLFVWLNFECWTSCAYVNLISFLYSVQLFVIINGFNLLIIWGFCTYSHRRYLFEFLFQVNSLSHFKYSDYIFVIVSCIFQGIDPLHLSYQFMDIDLLAIFLYYSFDIHWNSSDGPSFISNISNFCFSSYFS